MIAKKKKIKKIKKNKTNFFLILAIFIFILFIGFLAFSNLRMAERRKELNEKIENLRKEVNILEKRNEEMSAGIIEVETDAFWEEKLYEQGFKKSGEEAIIIIPPVEE